MAGAMSLPPIPFVSNMSTPAPHWQPAACVFRLQTASVARTGTTVCAIPAISKARPVICFAIPKACTKKSFCGRGANRRTIHGWAPDWEERASIETFCDVLLRKKLRQGIDCWWVDGDGPRTFVNKAWVRSMGAAATKESDHWKLPLDQIKSFNQQHWSNFHYYRVSQDCTRKRAMLLTRWGGIGSHRYPAWFSGDTCSTWRTLQAQVKFSATAGNVLTNYWTHDLGGFFGKKLPTDLFVRWCQFGAFTPIMRTHSAQGVREPWAYGKKAERIFRTWARLKCFMRPFWYGLSFDAWNTALPIIRPMYLAYPRCKESYRYRYQYLIGGTVLVAPVVRKDSRARIWFPEGEWIAPQTGESVKGPRVKECRVPLERVPLYVKANAMLAIAPDIDRSTHVSGQVQIECFPGTGPGAASYTFYDDDGETLAYRRGKYCTINFGMCATEDAIEIAVCPARGRYANMPRRREIRIVVHAPAGRRISRAYLDGRTCGLHPVDRVCGELPSRFGSVMIRVANSGAARKVRFAFAG
ncbi:MAG: DUF5110 domain-containing protein [Candidatus Lokiarchaeota archaeon]|nr:DUF5110 domain-containing protein [Candidatus Lokiarchaeota archaeon]